MGDAARLRPRRRAWRLAIVLAIVSLATVVSSQSGAPWPPALQTVTENSPALSPEAEMKTFVLPPGYRVELVASEPMVEEPVAIDWDASGRMWVVEMLGYMQDMASTRERDPIGRISVLEDTDRDGRMDKKTVFLDGLVLPRALKVLDAGGALVGEPPHLWLARDTNGDLKADTKELVCDCYGTAMANVEHNANSLLWAQDNWIHTSEHDTYLRLKRGKFEIRKSLARGQWGATQDDAGRVYRNNNSSALHVDVVPTPYYARNPSLLRTRGSFEFLGDPAELNATFPVRPNRGVNRGYITGQLRADGTLATYTAVCAPTVYRGDRLPADVLGDVFLAEPSGNLISRVIVFDDGTRLRGRKAYANTEFLTSTDERFRPVYLSSAPDGTLYVVDMYHGVIQHTGFITEYLRDHITSKKLEAPTRVGRIFRIVHDSTRRDEPPALATESSARLVERLAHPNGWWRDTAQQLLVQRGDTAVVGALTKLAEAATDTRTRLHALWTLDGLDTLEPATVIKGLDDRSRDVRAASVRLAERWLDGRHADVQSAVLARLDDTDWAVRHQLAATLGAMPAAAREQAAATLLDRHGTDPITMDATLSGLRGSEANVLNRVLASPTQTPARDAAVVMLAATIVRGAQNSQVQGVFSLAAEKGRAEWQQSALLRGAEVALQLEATMPGSPASRAGGAGPAPEGTGVGQRGGPGGAPAFPVQSAAGPTAAGRADGPLLRLNSEPALSALVGGGGVAGDRASALLARIEWPGKPGAAAPVTPLTVAEQRRFDEGQRIYQSLCQPCHQPDGLGQDRIAPSLLGARWTIAAPSVSVRILLNGKDGTVGLMPPLGASLTDEQIAAVLTYIRREWGQAASPVTPATVKDTRTQIGGRSRPWTDNELLALVNSGREGRR
ncbi:MAG: dehydrogenase [Acidobacteria bacterium]|nr:dehydrogenase [Acidobacteriota bacterium]